ncbi:MAG: hypothetical protein O2979_03965 [Proteobacteria bacterium]|nr:hypothetical protein [Pseudomonadota bacterium]
MATLAYAPLFAREDRRPDSFWISLQYFNLYPIVVALLFLGSTYFAYEPINFGAHDLRLFRAVCVGYLAIGIALQVVVRSVQERFNLQLSAHALLDVITIPLLMYASGGMRSSLGVMLFISLTGVGLVAPLRLNFLYAALATIAVLLEEGYWVLALNLPAANFVPPALLSMGYFATAGATGWLAQRLAANERLARERGRALANQTRVNQLVIEDMQDGVLVLDRQSATAVARLSPAALGELVLYDFPGNIRELENILERATALSAGGEIGPDDLRLRPAAAEAAGARAVEGALDAPLPEYLDRVEREAILQALARTNFNRTAAAKLLGVTFRTLRYRM